jgi:hypothetical protein
MTLDELRAKYNNAWDLDELAEKLEEQEMPK